jgi:rubrerythrin
VSWIRLTAPDISRTLWESERYQLPCYFSFSEAEIIATYPAGIIDTTSQNLKLSADGEKMEWGTLYPESGQVAEEEGFPKMHIHSGQVTKVESYHERRYRKLLDSLARGKFSGNLSRNTGNAGIAGTSTKVWNLP